jgi:hypothetical protein
MNGDQRISTIISLVLMVATAALGWFTLTDSLFSPRIADDRSAASVPFGEQDVVARLWEDPLQAVQAEVIKQGGTVDARHRVSALAAAIQETASSGKKIGILTVPIPGTPFPDDTEVRLRLRYSVQIALAQGGFAPDDRNHLGYFRIAWPGPEGVHVRSANREDRLTPLPFAAGFSNHVSVPYEWFGLRQSDSPDAGLKLLVLWLPEGLLGAEPLCRLAYLREQLAPPASLNGRLSGFFVLGPRSSDTLKSVAEMNLAFTNHVCAGLLREKLRIYSPQATAPDFLIGLSPSNRWDDARGDLANKFSRLGLPSVPGWSYFRNVIAPDDQLTDLLVKELALKDVDFRKHRILILAEADTSYGRALPLAFEASIQSHLAGNTNLPVSSLTPVKIQELAAASNAPAPPLIVARYLNGLDRQKGHQINLQNSRPNPQTADQALAEALSRKESMPLGESQLDYAERLVQALIRDYDPHTIRAVGVLGSDIYDKLILLRALRRKLPEAVFFTTDLDARLWHPDHFSFTRNLIVASAYGLEPPRPASKDYGIAPFRDGYQVAVFEACAAALRDLTGGTADWDPPPHPAVYELGRHGPVLLTSPLKSGGTREPDSSAAQSANLRPPPLINLDGTRIGGALLLLAALVGSGWLWRRDSRHRDPEEGMHFDHLWEARTGWAGFAFIGTLLLLIGFAILARWLSFRPQGEPWSWSDGVSVWPTEMVRLFTLCSMVWMFGWAWHRHLYHTKKLGRDFFAPSPGRPTAEKVEERPGWREVLKRINEKWPQAREGRDPRRGRTIEARAVFETYLLKAGLRPRLVRIALGTITYLALGFGIIFVSGGMPLRPQVRGEAARVLDLLLLITSIVGFLALVFYVLDSVWLSAQMLTRIARPFTVWPTPLVEEQIRQFRVSKTDIEGYLDVQFAAQKTRETGRLILLPFLIQFLMLVSRNSYFDDWSWPKSLVSIFVFNILLALAGWLILRRATRAIRSEALAKLRENLHALECEQARRGKSNSAAENSRGTPSLEERAIGLKELRRRIEEERRGAYARLFQDPALLAVLIPTGLLGILTVLFRALFAPL